MFKKIYLGTCFLLFVTVMYFVIITCKPVKNVKSTDVAPVLGVVKNVEIVRGNDLEIKLNNDDHRYYINNVIEGKINFEHLIQQIKGKQVTLYYIKRWTPLTTDGVYPHISKLKMANKVLFNELIDE